MANERILGGRIPPRLATTKVDKGGRFQRRAPVYGGEGRLGGGR